MPRKLTHERIFEYYKFNNYIMKSIYKNNRTQDELICPVGHEISMKYNDFQQGKRCKICSGNCRKKYIEIKNEIETVDGYILLTTEEEYNKLNMGSASLFLIKCNNNHIYKSNYDNFKNKEKRCRKCYFQNNIGKNHCNWNPDKSLNLMLRRNFKKSWIIKNLKHDINYNNFLLNKDYYNIDHIIPVKAFQEYISELDINNDILIIEEFRKNIVNNISNLSLIPIKENINKKDLYNKNDLIEYLKKFEIYKYLESIRYDRH